MIVSSRPDHQLDLQVSHYLKYKQLGTEMFAVLDPKGELRGATLSMAKKIAKKLVRELDENHRDTVSAKAMMCISLRKEWAKRYTRAPRHKLVGHQMYIGFLTSIHQQLTALKENETAAIHVRDQQADEQEIAEDGETDWREQQADEQEIAEDCQTDLTPGQADFLAFLECLIILAREAARLFEDVAQGKLPIWTASTLSNVILRRAENLIHVTRLLNDEEAPRTIWAASARGWDGGLSAPQLAQDWVDALDKASDRRPTIWGDMATLLPEIWNCLDSLVAPSLNAAANVFNSGHQPYAFQMLRHSFLAIGISTPKSVAQVPLVSLVGAYFCRLVTRKSNDGRSGLVDMDAAREGVCAEMNETLSLLPRLLKQNALTKEEVDLFRTMTGQMKQWAKACSEPMSLGVIHAFARTHWVHWHVRIVGSNSVPLQIFLYLCEKRRLQSSEDTLGGSEYEDLVGALLEDQRVAPHLLMNGRPRSVLECINALRHWCHLPTLNGDTLGEGGPSLTRKHIEAIENSSVVRNTTLLHEDIAQNGFCITKTMYARLFADERKKSFADDTTLLRYLNWEMGAPSCSKLESALFQAIQNTSEWKELRVAALLSVIQRQSGWQEALFNVLKSGLETVSEVTTSPKACGFIVLKQSFEIAVLKMALNVPGYEDPLKTELADVVGAIPGWKDSFADNVLRATMPGWQRIFRTFQIEPLSRSLHVTSLACIQYLLPPDEDLHNSSKGRNQVIEELLEVFMRRARPVLEETYRNNPNGFNK